MGFFFQYIRKIFWKTNYSYPLIRRRTRAYQRVRNVSISGNSACIHNIWFILKTPVVVSLGTSTYSVKLVIRRFTWVQQKCHRPYTPKYSFEFSEFLRAYSLNRSSVLYILTLLIYLQSSTYYNMCIIFSSVFWVGIICYFGCNFLQFLVSKI